MLRVLAPATSANLGSGFDVFGLALSQPRDEMRFQKIPEGIEIKVRGYEVPEDAEKNIAGIVARHILDKFSINSGIRIEINKKIRPESGLGSSAASAAGAAFGLNELFRLRLSKLQLVELALAGEKFASGAEHADNIAACIYGGFTICSYNPLRVLKFQSPKNLVYAAVLPEVELSTKKSREVLPKRVKLEDVVFNLAAASRLVAGFCRRNVSMIGSGMQDRIAEPARKKLVPLYEDVRGAALLAGASGAAISGSGPAIIALCNATKAEPKNILLAMKKVCEKHSLGCEIYGGKIGRGCRVVRE